MLAHLVDRHDVGMIQIAAASASARNRSVSDSEAKSPERIIFSATTRPTITCLDR